MRFFRKRKGQAATEYILLVALGLVIVVIGIAIAFNVKAFTDAVAVQAAAERAQAIAMLVE